jgi:uncharacterized protein YraI
VRGSTDSIITIRGCVQQSGLVDVLYEGQSMAAFMRDIQARAESVEALAAS